MEIKYRLIVTAPGGLKILDTPRPQNTGSITRRAVPVGTSLNAYVSRFVRERKLICQVYLVIFSRVMM